MDELNDIKESWNVNTEKLFYKLQKLADSNVISMKMLEGRVADLEKEREKAMCDLATLKHERDAALKDAAHYKEQVRDLKQAIAALEEENIGFKRVSQIIHYEKENAKLRVLITQLEDRLKKPMPLPTQDSKLTEQPHQEPEQEPSEPLEPEVEVYEKKIGKTIYFVSNDESMRIFEKTPEGEVGEELGCLQKINGKLKAVWNS